VLFAIPEDALDQRLEIGSTVVEFVIHSPVSCLKDLRRVALSKPLRIGAKLIRQIEGLHKEAKLMSGSISFYTCCESSFENFVINDFTDAHF
jgi:hypothetical protein